MAKEMIKGKGRSLRRRRRNSRKWKFSEDRNCKGKGKYLCFL